MDIDDDEFVPQSFVSEAADLKKKVDEAMHDPSVLSNSSHFESCVVVLEKYQEQCQLLDPHLGDLLPALFTILREQRNNPEAVKNLCHIIYIFSKVRGYKAVVKFFPHEVVDLEPTFALLESQNVEDLDSWEVRYVLLLWLSILIMIPFDLNTVDSTANAQEKQGSLILRTISLCKSCLGDSAKTRDAAAFLLSKLLTRPDVNVLHTKEFLEWSNAALSTTQSPFLIAGIYTALAAIFKEGHRSEMIDKIPIIVNKVLNEDSETLSTLQRKLNIKLAQRVGLIYLPSRIAPWRYQMGSRSLLNNLMGKANADAETKTDDNNNNDIDEDDDWVPLEIECVVERLLTGMKDKDTVVRWSAAKGIGRIANRLPRHLADEVVAAVLSAFNDVEGDGGWHGACLSLAELCRRGLLLPTRMPTVVPVVLKALQYDVRKGSASVGSHVRDAACYVCWAFARAYSPTVMQPYVQDIARGLVIGSVYDREVNGRRASSAGFQEHVGRQGNFPYGIDILTQADYFSLSNRTRSYTMISVYIAQYEEYRRPLIDSLAKMQLSHWDRAIRDLAAITLRKMVPLDSEYCSTDILQYLLPKTVDPDVPTRHGATLAVAEIILGCGDCNHPLTPEITARILSIVPDIEKARLFRGRGGEVLRISVCRLVEAMGLQKLEMNQKQLDFLFKSLSDNLKHPTEEIQIRAVAATSQMAKAYFPKEQRCDWVDKLVSSWITVVMEDDNPAAVRGHARLLGQLPKHLYRNADIISTLIFRATTIQEDVAERDAESRRNAVEGLNCVISTLGLSSPEDGLGMDEAQVRILSDALMKAAADYSTDQRGDIGSWVREAAMTAMATMLKVICHSEEHCTPQLVHSMILILLKQLSEKIDNVRKHAGTTLQEILLISPPVPHIHHRENLRLIMFSQDPNVTLDWTAGATVFPRMVSLMQFGEYRKCILSGIVLSVGGLTESLVKTSWSSLQQHIAELSEHGDIVRVKEIAEILMQLIEENAGIDRVTIPTLRTLDLLVNNRCFDILHGDEILDKLLEICRNETRGSREMRKIEGWMGLCSGLIRYDKGNVRNTALLAMLTSLCHSFPKVRRKASELLYVQLLSLEDLDEMAANDPTLLVDEALSMLCETDWFQPIAQVRPVRDRFYAVFGLEKPAVVAKATTSTAAATQKKSKDDGGYQDLINEMGY